MHLTNYSINKHSECFDDNEDFDKGTKRTIKYFNGWLVRNGYNISDMWSRIYVSNIKISIPNYKYIHSIDISMYIYVHVHIQYSLESMLALTW